MIYKLIIFAFMLLYFLYIITVVCHCFNLFKITYQNITIGKALIPFYYWFNRENKKVKKHEQSKNH